MAKYICGIVKDNEELRETLRLIEQQIDSLEVLKSLCNDFEKILIDLRLETARKIKSDFYQMHNHRDGMKGVTRQFAYMVNEMYGS